MKLSEPCSIDVICPGCSTLGMNIKVGWHTIASFCIQSYFIYTVLEIEECIMEKLLLKVRVPDSVTTFDRTLIFEW